MFPAYRDHLRTAVSASAAPYGYTLTIWTSAAVTSHTRGMPSTFDAVLLVCGAALGFLLAATLAFGSVDRAFGATTQHQVRIWGGLHLPSVCAGILVASLIAHIVPYHLVGWLLVGLASTGLYLLVIAGQFALATRRTSLPPPDPPPGEQDGS